MRKPKTLLQKINELEAKGWEYDDDFRLPTFMPNTLVQLKVMKKGNEYRTIDYKNNRIKPTKKILSYKTCQELGLEY